jgi:MFS family permease
VKISIKAFIIAFELPLLQPFSSAKVIVTEIGQIMKDFDKTLSIYSPLFINIVQLLATGSAFLLLLRWGRRPILVLGSFIAALCAFFIGLFFLLNFITGLSSYVFISLGFTVLLMIDYGSTIGPTVWLYVPEIVPVKVVPVATSMNWMGVAFSVMVTPYMIEAAGSPYPVFFMFAGVSLVFSIINYFFVVETKGLEPS